MAGDFVARYCPNSACLRRSRVRADGWRDAVCEHCGTRLTGEVQVQDDCPGLSDVLAELERKWSVGKLPVDVPDAPAQPLTEAEQFVAQLEHVPWFANLGRPHADDELVARFWSWEEWPGPDDPGVHFLNTRQQELYDALLLTSRDREGAVAFWHKVESVVLRVTSKAVPYSAEKDCWHAPSSAVWQAVWTAGLMALCLREKHRAPRELREQWKWFIRGHWPAGYASVDEDETPGLLLVY